MLKINENWNLCANDCPERPLSNHGSFITLRIVRFQFWIKNLILVQNVWKLNNRFCVKTLWKFKDFNFELKNLILVEYFGKLINGFCVKNLW